jgi:WD40 repeat protein
MRYIRRHAYILIRLILATSFISLLMLPRPELGHTQDLEPITKENLLAALKDCKRRRDCTQCRRCLLGTADFIEQIKRLKVNFRLETTSEEEIRQAGDFLGANGVSDLITAVRLSYEWPVKIYGVSPKVGLTTGGTPVVITGRGFKKGATVHFKLLDDGNPGLATSVVVSEDGKTITALTPSHQVGMVEIWVHNVDKSLEFIRGAYEYVRPQLATSAVRLIATTPEGLEPPSQPMWKRDEEGDYFRPQIIFDPRGKTVAYEARQHNSRVVVVGNKKGDPFSKISMLNLSSDGGRSAYVEIHLAAQQQKSSVVVDGIKGKDFDEVSPPVFSPDGKQVAYRAIERGDFVSGSNKYFIIIRDLSGKEFKLGDLQFSYASPPSFNPVTGNIAYIARDDGNSSSDAAIYVNEKKTHKAEGGQRSIFHSLVYSDDGKHLAYVSSEAKTEAFIVVDNMRGPTFKSVRAPVFSKQGNVAYAAMTQDTTWKVVIFGQAIEQSPTRTEEFSLADVGQPVFSPDGKNLAYAGLYLWTDVRGKTGANWGIIINGKWIDNGLLDNIASLVFSPSGNKLAFAAMKEDSRVRAHWRVIIDGKESPKYEWVDQLTFISEDKLEFGAFEGKFFRWNILQCE